MGVLFGVYHQTEFLSTEQLYNSALPQELGYTPYKTAIEKNPFSYRALNGETYVRIHKSDKLYLRYEHEPDWARQLRERQGGKQ